MDECRCAECTRKNAGLVEKLTQGAITVFPAEAEALTNKAVQLQPSVVVQHHADVPAGLAEPGVIDGHLDGNDVVLPLACGSSSPSCGTAIQEPAYAVRDGHVCRCYPRCRCLAERSSLQVDSRRLVAE